MAHIDHRSHLRADCARCTGLCCVALAFAPSADFAIDKPAGTPCPHLAGDSRCSIHDRLPERGFRGCTTYDCFGAGQRVVGDVLPGTDWRADPAAAGRMFAVFHVVRGLHELLWYVAEAASLVDGPLHAELEAVRVRLEGLAGADADVVAAVDVDEERAGAVPLLRAASERARAGSAAPDLPRDLVGRDLRGADLAGADLRGALLIGADLRGAVLERTDLTGADLRGADVRGTDLARALFLTQQQVAAADGDAGTTLPEALGRPGQWPVDGSPG
ncbi:pentapeptide repeat-containing protein [Nocardioides sp. NPDC092400]|uniref:pentapeptide repeat-containing protein n=1 Tax=Nocardioides sp. NPDC092400 TaxID=3155196 RepID=UPI003424B2FD